MDFGVEVSGDILTILLGQLLPVLINGAVQVRLRECKGRPSRQGRTGDVSEPVPSSQAPDEV